MIPLLVLAIIIPGCVSLGPDSTAGSVDERDSTYQITATQTFSGTPNDSAARKFGSK
jgi:hypothetical protein